MKTQPNLTLLILLLCMICSTAYGQADTSEIRFVESKAKSWFKDVYVEKNFKDPYSYELLKIILTPVTLREKIERSISIKRELYGDITPDKLEDIKASYEMYKTQMDSLQTRYNRKGKGLSKLKQMEYDSAESLYLQSLATYTYRKKEYESYINDLEYYESMDWDDSIDKSNIVEYIVNLDCHASNSYGNKVLGRYRFIISRDGTVNSDPIKTN